MNALNMYLQIQVFKNLENFLKVYAFRKKVTISELRHEIKEKGIRLFYLQKIAYCP